MPEGHDDPYLVPKPDPNQSALADPRVSDFLSKIGQSEGADYNTLVGGRKINDLSKHPNVVGLTTSAGPSTAFGKYQITGTTDRTKLAKYKGVDYSPQNQDLRAVELLRQTGALDAIQSDDPATAVKRAGREWASLPGSPLPGRKSSAFSKTQDPYLVPKPAPPINALPTDDPYLVANPQSPQTAPQAPPKRASRGAAAQVASQMRGAMKPDQQAPSVLPQIGGAPSLAKILPGAAGTSTPISPLRQRAAQNVAGLTFDPVANVKSLARAVTGSQGDIDEEEQRLKDSQALQADPSMIAAQKRIGSVPATVSPDLPSPRGVVSGGQRFVGGMVKELGGFFDAIGDAGLGGLGPATKPVAGQIRDYLNKRGEILQQSASLPLDAQGQAIERALPEKATDAVTGLGLSVAQLVLLKKATGMSLGSIMASESYLQNSDKPLTDRAAGAAESYAMGRVLDTHMSRPVSALAFGGPTAVSSALQVAQGNKSVEDAILDTAVQGGAGAILGGKSETPDILKGGLVENEVQPAGIQPEGLRGAEARPQVGGELSASGVRNETGPAAIPEVRHVDLQPRAETGQSAKETPAQAEIRRAKVASISQPEPSVSNQPGAAPVTASSPEVVPSMSRSDYRRAAASKAEMVKQGASGALSSGVRTDIPLSKIDGLEPVPAMEGGYKKGTPITTPIEVEYDPAQDKYMLYSGNHRVEQARVNGDATVPAFVERNDFSPPEVSQQGATDPLTALTQGEANAITTGQRPQDNLEQYPGDGRGGTPTEPSSSSIVEQRAQGAQDQAQAAQGERQFPKTLESTGREGGTDRTYQVVGDKEAVAAAQDRVAKDPEAARQFALGEAKPDTPQGKERIATGLTLADQLSREAESSTDKTEAATKHAQAAELYTKLSTDLTEAGQTVQAASLARKYSPVGAPLEVARIAKAQGVTPKAEDISAVREMAKRQDDLEGRIAEIQKQIENFKVKGTKGVTVTPGTKAKIPTLVDRLSTMESQARARLEARKSAVVTGKQAGASTIPLDIADYSIIGASKLAKGGLNFAKWSAEMVKEFGDDVKPHLDKIFMASHKSLTEQRAAMKEESLGRGAAKAGQSIEDFRQQRYELQVQKRQVRSDLDRKFRELESASKQGPLQKTDQIASTMLRDGLLSFHGLFNILSGMGAKQIIDTAGRVGESAVDIARVRGAQMLGREVPRTAAGVSLKGVAESTKYLVTKGAGNIGKSLAGKPSEVMPESYRGPFESPVANALIGPMGKLYGAKETLIRSWAYPTERQNQASVLAHNDVLDGVIKRGELNTRISDYLNGRADIEGPRNKTYVDSLSKNAADYEVKTKEIIPSARDMRARELAKNPSQLVDSAAKQYADKQVYAEPLGPRMQKLQQGLKGSLGRTGEAVVMPFLRRPSNAIKDLLYTYTGARIPVEAIKNSFGADKWNPTQIRSFNQALARGGAGPALYAIGYALAGRGMLTSQNDKDHPGSLKVGDKYYAISHVPVIGWLLTAGATHQKEGASSVPGAMAKMIAEHPLLRSVKNAADAVQEGLQATQGNTAKIGKAVSSFAAKTAARFVPTPVAAAAETLDTQRRDTRGILGPTKARIPFVRQGLPATGAKERGSAFDPFLGSIPLKSRSKGSFKF